MQLHQRTFDVAARRTEWLLPPDTLRHEAWYYDPFNALASDDDNDVEELLDLKQSRQAN